MGELRVILATTLDGMISGDGGSLDWIIMGDDRGDYMVDSMENVDTLMLGRKTYQSFLGWRDVPNDPDAPPAAKEIGRRFNAMRKVVYSKTLQTADWHETTIYRDIVPAEVERLKAGSSEIRLDGSISVIQQMTDLGLIDEYRLMVHPVALGKGRPLFVNRVDLALTGVERFSTGVVVLTYMRQA